MKKPSSKALIVRKGKILLLGKTHKKSVSWELPGGKLEGKETFVEGLIREIKEETKLPVSNPDLLFTQTSRNGKTKSYFIVKYKGSPQVIISDEHDIHRWATPKFCKKANKEIKDLMKQVNL